MITLIWIFVGFVINFFIGAIILSGLDIRTNGVVTNWIEDQPLTIFKIITIAAWPIVLFIFFKELKRIKQERKERENAEETEMY